jgi:hypothetical protein
MTKDEIIDMAKEAGLVNWEATAYANELERFAKLVAEREREACAKACEEVIFKVKPTYCVVAENCVKVIRARGQE